MNPAHFILLSLALVGTAPGCTTATWKCGPPTDLIWAQSTGNDDYNRVLDIRTTDFAGRYTLSDPIPVTVELRNRGSIDSEYQTAQLFPHLNVWIEHDGVAREQRIPLEIENRLWIERGETWRHEFDLAEVVELEHGSYTVAVGHSNAFVEDLGDWTGTLRSDPLQIQIVPDAR